MPLTLEETNLLIAVLGIKVPPAVLEQKVLEEKFRKREAEVAARSGEMQQRSDGSKLQGLFNQAGTVAKGKDFAAALKLLDQVEAGLAMPDPADEYRMREAEIGNRSGEMKQRGDGAKILELFGQAAAAAAANDFAAAEKLLDQVEAGLAQPDPAEAFRKRAAGIKARSGEMTQRNDGAKLKDLFDQAAIAAAGDDFAAAMNLLIQVEAGLSAPDAPPPPPPTPSALAVWRDAKDAVDAQCGQLYDKLKRVGLPVLIEAANQIENVLGGYRTKLVVALTNFDGAAGDAKEKARTAAIEVIGAYQDSIPNDIHVIAADSNPFGVQVTIRETLGAALNRLRQQLSSV